MTAAGGNATSRTGHRHNRKKRAAGCRSFLFRHYKFKEWISKIKEEFIMDKKFEEMGKRARIVRRELGLTLQQMAEETGISRSYLSDFENGKRSVTAKYLKYLAENHNVNLNYIFFPDERVFRVNEKEELNGLFDFEPNLRDLLLYIRKIPHAKHVMLAYFCQYRIEYEHIIRAYFKELFPTEGGQPQLEGGNNDRIIER